MRAVSERWVIAIAAAVVMLLIGTLYSWAVFVPPLILGFGWKLTTTTWTYAIANFSLATVGVVVGGLWLDRRGPRRVALTGIGLWGVGSLLAGWGTPSWGAPWLYLTYGVLGGVGAGMAYITPLAVVSKWFPERRGLLGGLVVGCFGLGAFLYSQIVASHLLVSRDPARGVMQIFIASGAAFLAIGLPAAALLRNPGAVRDEELAHHPARSAAHYPPARVVRMPQFYLLWLQLFANVIAGIALISNAVVILTELTRLTSTQIVPLFGLVSISNAIGRFVWGGISDRIGCRRTFAAMFAVQAFTLYGLCAVDTPAVALGGCAVVLLCCGGGFGTMPSYCAQCFGTRYMGLNYGMVLTAWGAAGLIGPMLLARAHDIGLSFADLMPAIACALTASLILPLLTRRPAAQRLQTADTHASL